MSGGVDSAVAALLTLRDGYDCTGATMRLSGFASADGIDFNAAAAQSTAERLGIPFFTFDFRERFTKQVIEPFIAVYRDGRTPNPCVMCNKHIKFGAFLEKALETERDCIVTGHYAQTGRDAGGRCLLKKGSDTTKDQSYVLYTLSQEQLARIRFPLGELTKRQVREIAKDAGLAGIPGGESQDICFIPDGDYAKFIMQYTGESPRKGRFVDTGGNDLGESKSVISYTIGQRRGLGLAMPHPSYVLELQPGDNTVVVGKEDLLYSKTFDITDINLIPLERLDTVIRAQVRIRYSDPGHQATIRQTTENSLHIEFDEPQRAITKGQSAVIYDGDVVIGGGIII